MKKLWGVLWRVIFALLMTAGVMLLMTLLEGCSVCSHMECPPIQDSTVINFNDLGGLYVLDTI